MRFSCESCGAQYMISDEKVGPGGVKVRCKKCGNVIPVRRAGGAPADAGEAGAAAGAAVELSRPEADLDRDLDHAFHNVLGGGSIGGGTPTDAAGPAASNAVSNADVATEWYVAIDDRQVGPMPASGVRSRWESGEIGPDTLAWHPGMNDWSPLASIPEMTRYLASATVGAKSAGSSQPRTSAAVEPAATASVSTAAAISNGTNGKLNGHAGAWQPSAGVALAALAAQELTPDKPVGIPGSSAVPAANSGPSLLEKMDLPEGGVDPTHLIPLAMKGVETTEVDLKAKASVQPERTEIRQIRKEAKRSGAAMGVAVATVAAAGIGVALWLFRPVSDEHPAPAPAAAPAPVTASAAPPASPAQTQPSVEQHPSSPGPGAPSPTAEAASPVPPSPQPPAPPETSPVTQPDRAAQPEHAAPAVAQAPVAEPPRAGPPAPAAEPAPPARPSKAEAAVAPKRPTRRERLAAAAAARAARQAAAEPAPRPEPTRKPPPVAAPAPTSAPAVAAAPRSKGGDPLLDVGGDDDLEKELSSTKPKRSVYVPPAIGSDVPENVSVSQINEAVVGQKAALLRCIEQQRAADPNARGTLKLRWIIGGDGATRDVRVLSDEFSKQPIGGCISGVVKGIRFPRSRTSGQEVVFPFKF